MTTFFTKKPFYSILIASPYMLKQTFCPPPPNQILWIRPCALKYIIGYFTVP